MGSTLFSGRRERGEINGVWITLALVLGGLLFLVFTFLPPWYKSLNAKEKIGQIISGYSSLAVDEEEMSEKVAAELRKMDIGVEANDIIIDFDKKSLLLKVNVNWTANVKYLFLNKYQKVNFRMKVKRKLSN